MNDRTKKQGGLLGQMIEDERTGFSGLAIGCILLEDGTCRYTVQPVGLADNGEPKKAASIDSGRLRHSEGKGPNLGEMQTVSWPTSQMGALARDEVTGYIGIVTAQHISLFDLPEVVIEASALKPDGSIPDGAWLHEARTTILTAGPCVR